MKIQDTKLRQGMSMNETAQKMRYYGRCIFEPRTAVFVEKQKSIQIEDIKSKEDIHLWLKQQNEYFFNAKGLILFDEAIINWMR